MTGGKRQERLDYGGGSDGPPSLEQRAPKQRRHDSFQRHMNAGSAVATGGMMGEGMDCGVGVVMGVPQGMHSLQHHHHQQQQMQQMQHRDMGHMGCDIGHQDLEQDGASKRKEANNSLYFPSPDPSYHPHVPYSTYKLMRHNTGVGGASSHSPTQQQRHEMPVNKPVLKHSISQDCAVDLRQLACQEPTIQTPVGAQNSIQMSHASRDAHLRSQHSIAIKQEKPVLRDHGYDAVSNQGVPFSHPHADDDKPLPFRGSSILMGDLDVAPHNHNNICAELASENLVLKEMVRTARLQVTRLTELARTLTEKKAAEEESQSRYWSAVEHQRFLDAVNICGPKDVKSIAQYVGTRNATQVRTHAQKYSMKVSRQSKNGGKGGAKVQKDSGVKGSTNASGSANECDGSETSNSEQASLISDNVRALDQATSWCISDDTSLTSSSGQSRITRIAAVSDSKSSCSGSSSLAGGGQGQEHLSSTSSGTGTSMGTSAGTSANDKKRGRASSSSVIQPSHSSVSPEAFASPCPST